MRAAAAVTAVLSFSNLGYFYIDDWPEVFLGWCLVPFCLWSAVGLLEASRTGGERLGRLSMCALAFGMLVANGHPLHTFIWFTVLMLFFLPVVAARPRWFVPLALAAALAALGGLDIVVQTLGGLGSSHGTFNPTDDPTRYPVLTANDYLGFLQPLRSMAATGWSGLMQPAYGRRPFYGAVFFVLALGDPSRRSSGRTSSPRCPIVPSCGPSVSPSSGRCVSPSRRPGRCSTWWARGGTTRTGRRCSPW